MLRSPGLGRKSTNWPTANLWRIMVPSAKAGAAAGRRAAAPAVSSVRLQVRRRQLALLAALDLEADLLPLVQAAEAGALDRGDVHEHILRSVVRLDEAEALL